MQIRMSKHIFIPLNILFVQLESQEGFFVHRLYYTVSPAPGLSRGIAKYQEIIVFLHTYMLTYTHPSAHLSLFQLF